MPPIRTQDTKQRGVLSFPGFGPRATAVAQRETKSSMVQVPAQATTATSGSNETHGASGAVETREIIDLTEIDESSAAPARLIVNAPRRISAPVNRGEKEVTFQDNQQWETNHRNWLGFETKKVTFGSGFILKDAHINEMISIGPHLCRNLTHFTFQFRDMSYEAKNSAEELTDETMVRLIKLCPKLRSMQLQGTSGLKDFTLETLFRYCPHISHVELTTHIEIGENSWMYRPSISYGSVLIEAPS